MRYCQLLEIYIMFYLNSNICSFHKKLYARCTKILQTFYLMFSNLCLLTQMFEEKKLRKENLLILLVPGIHGVLIGLEDVLEFVRQNAVRSRSLRVSVPNVQITDVRGTTEFVFQSFRSFYYFFNNIFSSIVLFFSYFKKCNEH